MTMQSPDQLRTPPSIEDLCHDLAVASRNSALEAAAEIARLYGASEEACELILMMKGRKREDANV